jgi:hypothetical protein
MRVAPIVAFLLLGAACAAEPTPPPIVPVRSEAAQLGIRLQLDSPRSIVREGEAIEVIASVANERDEAVTLWSSSAGGPIAFGVLRLQDGLVAESDWTDDGVAYELPPGEPVTYPFQKSASWAPGDPDAAFQREYAADPELHLPPGRWRIEAVLHGVLGDRDGPSTVVVAVIEVIVTE